MKNQTAIISHLIFFIFNIYRKSFFFLLHMAGHCANMTYSIYLYCHSKKNIACAIINSQFNKNKEKKNQEWIIFKIAMPRM